MKKLIIVATILFSINSFAQDLENKFAAQIITEPGAYKDGVNVGFGIEYQMTTFYTGAEVFIFPNLNGETYTHLIGKVGINFRTRFQDFRIFIGAQAGNIFRPSPSPTVGIEAGLNFNIPNTNFYLGLANSYNYRTDGKYQEKNVKEYWQYNLAATFGIRF
ncbi:hypothetical protein [Bizionia myxarmorum]|uniref:Porin family protein n=1 Tax=Bizionia myxarmorum TaxID=291186 RepID=A0A5D0RA09_9FLAO|nr:hypothetical protein [Bizionia myxarmorum]TYB78317.1 hypothetical protein ES674_00625 [Bizionia myxarmorum]